MPRLSTLLFLFCLRLLAQSWPQWAQNSGHTGAASVSGQNAARILAASVYDPFVPYERGEAGGDLTVHYQVPLVDDGDLFMVSKGGTWIPCDPPGSGEPFPCGPDAWSSQTWSEKRFHWENGQLIEKWNFESDWKPEPDFGNFGGWEPVFQPALTGDYLFIPGAGGTVWKLKRDDGTVVAHINPFGSLDSRVFTAGPLVADSAGNIYYNALGLNLTDDARTAWGTDIVGAWLVKINVDGSTAAIPFSDLTAGAPAASARCEVPFNPRQAPWPPAPDAAPRTAPCGSQRPGINVAPAIAPDGTIYTVSRSHFNSRYGYLIAVNPDLSLKWTASLRDRLNDGCGVLVPAAGQPGACRNGAPRGVDPATNRSPAGRVLDSGTSSPVITPDGSVLYGAYSRYNYARGHLMKFSADGSFLASYDFGWDITPAIYQHDGTYSVVLKDNHYDLGSYCEDEDVCPPAPQGPYNLTQLDPDLLIEWTYTSKNTLSCQRDTSGSVFCEPDHFNGFEWCINAPAVDANGSVYANSEDGNLYIIGQGGVLRASLFTNLALGGAYTPLSLGPDGIIYTQNEGVFLAVGN